MPRRRQQPRRGHLPGAGGAQRFQRLLLQQHGAVRVVPRLSALLGIPVIPTMSTGATDAVYTGGDVASGGAGIPTYGIPGYWTDPDGNGTHGLNERIGVQSLLEAREFSYRLVKLYAAQKD